jgi:hypothetical protein
MSKINVTTGSISAHYTHLLDSQSKHKLPPAGSMSRAELAKDASVVISSCGTFLGHTLRPSLLNKRLPPMAYSCCLPDHSQPKYRLVDRPPANSCVSKLCFRFVNTHTTIAHQDGSIFTEMLSYDPRHFFRSMSIAKVLDAEEMERWYTALHDTDPQTGLPKALEKEHYNRQQLRATQVERNGCTYLDWELHVFEYDSATADWSRLRCTTTVSYSRKGR